MTVDRPRGWRSSSASFRTLVVLSWLGALLSGVDEARAQSGSPRFRTDGVDAVAMGWRDGYPACLKVDYAEKQHCRVGAFSNFDSLFPARTVSAPKTAHRLLRAAREPVLRYSWNGRELGVEDYLDRRPVTGFIIARDDEIVLERYQYARTDGQRLTSFSMAKTVVALLVGAAAKDGLIQSIDEPAERYARELTGSEYGRTPIRALLHMSSGVAFKEEYANADSDIAALSRGTLLGLEAGGSPAVLRRFNARVAAPDTRWSYASAETSALGLVVSGATGRSLSDYLREKIWEPMGAEAAASWIVDATGREVAFAYLNATLRDWARLGLMLAHDGTWAGREIVSRDWLRAGTTIAPSDPHLRFSRSYWAGYGYQAWLIPGSNRAFALQGYRGQFVMVDPATRVVLVQTAARPASDEAADRELLALFQAVSAQLASRGR